MRATCRPRKSYYILATWLALAAGRGIAAPPAVPLTAARVLADELVPAGIVPGDGWELSDLEATFGGEATWTTELHQPDERFWGLLCISADGQVLARLRAPTPRYLSARRLPIGHLQAVAETFARRWMPASLVKDYALRSTWWPAQGLSSEVESFDVVCFHRETRLPIQASVGVRRADGRVRSYGLRAEPIVVPLEPALARDEAEAVAREHLAQLEPVVLELWKAEQRIMAAVAGMPQRHLYSFYFRLPPLPEAGGDAEEVPVCGVVVDALTGRPDGGARYTMPTHVVESLRAGGPYPPPTGPEWATDSWPAWRTSADGRRQLLFTSRRSCPGEPRWAALEKALFTIGADGTDLEVIASIEEEDLNTPAAGGDYLVARSWTRGEAVLFDLRTGERRRVASEERPAEDLAVSSDGRWLAVAADRRGGDGGIFVADLRRGRPGLQRRLIAHAGEDRHPAFAGGGRQLYFAHRPAEADARWEIRRAGIAEEVLEAVPSVTVVGDLPQILRLTVSADGRRALAWHVEGIDLIDLTAGRREALQLPVLRDPTLPDGLPLEVTAPALSPNGEQMAFAARRWSGKAADPRGSYLYVCRLDGSELRRITPVEDVVMPPFIFPATGRPALEAGDDVGVVVE